MLLAGDLGFWCSLVVVVVGWFVGRRKWRRVVARKEEIRRLMMLASEETARAELEAAGGYTVCGSGEAPAPAPVKEPEPVAVLESSPVRQVQYHCEVCLSPTTTRCKQCKAVRYCSRKCQIIHWREGHKDECLSFIARRNIEGELQSHFNKVKQDETTSSQDVVGNDIEHTTKPVELPSDGHVVSNPRGHVRCVNNDTQTEISDSWKKTDGNLKESTQQSLPDDCSLSTSSDDAMVIQDSNLKDLNRDNGSPDKKLFSMKPLLSSNLTNPECGVAASSDSNKLLSGCIDIDEKPECLPSSGCNVTASEEHLFAEPSKSAASDFWAGSIKPNISKIDARDEFRDANVLRSRSHLQPSNARVETLDSDAKRVRVDAFPSTSISRKSTDISELREDVSKSRGQVLSNVPGQNGAKNAFVDYNSMKEVKVSTFSAFSEHVSEELAPGNHIHIDDVSNSQSLAPPEILDHEFDGTNGNLGAVNQTDSSRSFETHLTNTSNTAKSILGAQAVQNQFSHADSAFALCRRCYLLSAKGGSNVSAKRVMSQLKSSNFIRHVPLGSESGIKGQQEGGSFSYELFVKLYNWNKIELYPSGLKNCGNSCYANAVLQCLAVTPPLTAYFLQGLHAKDCKKKEWCFTCELEALVSKAKERHSSPQSPARIMSELQQIGRNLGHGREEDAHEFLRSAIDALQAVCLKETGVNTPSSLDEETTLLGLTFGGYLQSKIECMACGGKSKQNERIMDLTVEICGEIGSLEDALRQFTRSEILDGENKYHCNRCCSYEKAKKKLRVLEAPNVLTIALKRFQSGKFGKLTKAVKFPEILNLARYMSRTSDKSPIYQLYGVVVHLDIMNSTFSGHYVCYVKNNHGRWYKADDSVVQKVEIQKVLSQDAYMLFYSRCSPRAPRPIRSRRDPRKACKVQPHPPRPWNTSEGGLTAHDICAGGTSQNHAITHLSQQNSECDSENSSLFSDGISYSTESSNSESTSTIDNFDQILGDRVRCWNANCRRSTSDSDATSSSSSSSSSWSSSPKTTHSPLANMDRYSSDTEPSNSPSTTNPDGFWARRIHSEKGAAPVPVAVPCNECKGGSSSKNNKINRLIM